MKSKVDLPNFTEIIEGFYSDNSRRKKGVLLSERVLVIYTEIEVIIREFNKGSMAELVDAPDSKSGHFGGVGSIPSTPTKKNENSTHLI